MMARKKSAGLNEKHIKVLQTIENFTNTFGYPPTIREIMERAHLSSTSVVNYYLDQLEEKGYIERSRGISRGLRVLKQFSDAVAVVTEQVLETVHDFLSIPLVGRIVASEPIPFPSSDFKPYDAESSMISIAKDMLPVPEKNIGDIFAMEVSGDSMIDAMVNDGDIVILKKTGEARNGDMVAIWLNDNNETTLKYFFDEGKRIRLQPANPTMDPIYIRDRSTVEVHGKVVMVVRKLSA